MSGENEVIGAFAELERGVLAALETYSNVHRGSGQNSMVTTCLYEQARDIVLEYLGLNKSIYTVIFCSPVRAASLIAKLEPESYQSLSSHDIGLSLGIRALAVRKKALPKGAPSQSGGGTTRLLSKSWVIWADAPDRFEAGTPAIINIIAFAKALRLVKQYGKEIFLNAATGKLTASEILFHDDLEKFSGQELLDQLRQTIIGRGVNVPTMEGAKPYINLDNSASTPAFTPVWNAFCNTWRQSLQVKHEIIDKVKSICAGMLDAPQTSFDMIFTSNTTEAINLVAGNLTPEFKDANEHVVLITLLEHSSNDLPWRMVPGYSLIRFPVDAEGFMDLNDLEMLMSEYNQKGKYGKKRIRLVAISGASNVLGVCNNIGEVSRIVHRYGARILVDAAQLVAHRKVSMEGAEIDYLAFSAHKVYAPFGCGILVYRKGLLNLNNADTKLIQLYSEENAGGIAALGKSLVLLQRIGMDLIAADEHSLTKRALRGMAQTEGLSIYGIKDPDSPAFACKIGVIVFSIKGMMPDRVAEELALRSGIGVRYGCHCAHIMVKRLLNVPPFLERLQRLIVTMFPKLKLPGVVRISLGIGNSGEDIDTLIRVLGKIAGKSLTSAVNRSAADHNEEQVLSRAGVKQQMKDFTKAAAMRVYLDS